MRTVDRIAAYVPLTVVDEVPAGAPDEDEFTLGATAAERVWIGRHEAPGALAVHLLGEFPAAADWGFAPLLGRETEAVVRHTGTAAELGATLRALEEGSGGPALAVASELPERTRARAEKSSAIGAAAVAYLLEEVDEPSPLPLPKLPATRTAVGATLRLMGSPKAVPRSVTFIGDWDRPPGAGRTMDSKLLRKAEEANLGAVAEGAYVPRPRYLENLPSRWRFLAELCGACHGTTFPARGVCRHCGRSDALTLLPLPHDGGRVVAITTVGKGGQPTEFDGQVEALGAYDVALVELARGRRVTLQVSDAVPGTLRVGDHVDTRLRRLYPMEGEWRYGRKAVPSRTSPRRETGG